MQHAGFLPTAQSMQGAPTRAAITTCRGRGTVNMSPQHWMRSSQTQRRKCALCIAGRRPRACKKSGPAMWSNSPMARKSMLTALGFGHTPSKPPGVIDAEVFDDDRFVAHPWSADALRAIAPDASVLLVGTG